jgi:hypothetical protein
MLWFAVWSGLVLGGRLGHHARILQ